ncbi:MULTISPECIES: Rpn family recombination-promoting nuclease/putative transposase [Kluyvera]|uniref:Rpn family recombination-promoting nuclease/putative transposase n=1 Tax=Kluyvera TaxID=579 RepID=UPI00200BE4D4|nr:Rpn family recombination-promoting nuclease/putative transposase [Kluyvera ascorbata]
MDIFSTTPHDAIFKQLLRHKAIALDFLQVHLPQALLSRCNLATLRLTSSSFVEESLRASHSDILYSLQTCDGPGYIYVLIEHQSTTDKLMPFRLMRYAIAAMQQHLDAGHDTLPLVIPMLFYHGSTSPWPFHLNWLALFADPEIATRLYTQDFPLIDITVVPDSEIMTHRRMAMLELLLKHIRQRDLATLQEQLGALLVENWLTAPQLKALISYMLQSGRSQQKEKLMSTLGEYSPQHEEQLMTIAEWLAEKGRKQGEAMGRREEAFKIAHNMLNAGLSITLITQLTGLSAEDLATTTE